MVDKEHAVVWAATATGGILAATALYWVCKKALDAYVPYQVSCPAGLLIVNTRVGMH